MRILFAERYKPASAMELVDDMLTSVPELMGPAGPQISPQYLSGSKG